MNTVDNDKLILVPCDFSPLFYHALEHGAYMSKSTSSRLMILHAPAREAEMPAMEKKLCFVVEECFEKFGVRPETMVRQGSQPYSVIKAVVKEIKPALVILKTGGGVQTVKMMSGTSTPFLVIQGPPKYSVLKNIVFPINFLNNHDEKLKRVFLFNGFYPDAVMHIITPSGKGTLKEKNISGNIKLLGKVMDAQNIKYNFITHDKMKNKAENILELSKDTDMIIIQMEDVSSFTKVLFGLREEKLITNTAKIPVLCFNRESDFMGIN